MATIQTFLSKWGLIIILFLSLSITLSTCGVKTHVERLEKKVLSLEKQINYNDSINQMKQIYEMEIYNLKVERSVLHNMNEIVLKNTRPSQRISEINNQIEQINKELKSLK